MMAPEKVITVFGRRAPREGCAGYEQERALGRALGERGWKVCTGGYGGVMEGVSRGAKEAGGKTVGVTADFFQARANRWVDEEIRVVTWQDRLFELIRRGDAYVACKGGTGTLVELAGGGGKPKQSAVESKPFVTLGGIWQANLADLRAVDLAHSPHPAQ